MLISSATTIVFITLAFAGPIQGNNQRFDVVVRKNDSPRRWVVDTHHTYDIVRRDATGQTLPSVLPITSLSATATNSLQPSSIQPNISIFASSAVPSTDQTPPPNAASVTSSTFSDSLTSTIILQTTIPTTIRVTANSTSVLSTESPSQTFTSSQFPSASNFGQTANPVAASSVNSSTSSPAESGVSITYETVSANFSGPTGGFTTIYPSQPTQSSVSETTDSTALTVGSLVTGLTTIAVSPSSAQPTSSPSSAQSGATHSVSSAPEHTSTNLITSTIYSTITIVTPPAVPSSFATSSTVSSPSASHSAQDSIVIIPVTASASLAGSSQKAAPSSVRQQNSSVEKGSKDTVTVTERVTETVTITEKPLAT